MTLTDQLKSRTLALAAESEENFLELGQALQQLQELDLDEFKDAVRQAGFSTRKAYCLISVERAFGSFSPSRGRLIKIGWTKLHSLVGHVNEDNLDELLTLAETHTAKELQAVMRGRDPAEMRKPVVLYLSQEQFDMLEIILLNFGASRRKGRGLIGREEAVMEMAWWAQTQLDGMEPEVDGQLLSLVRQLGRAHAQRDHFAQEAERLKRRLIDMHVRMEALQTRFRGQRVSTVGPRQD